MKANKQMLTLLSNRTLEEVLADVSLSDGLSQLLESPLQEYEGAIFLNELFNETSTRADGDDLTGWECFVNHIHIDDFTGAV